MRWFDASLSGALIIEPSVYEDNRGFFMESYNARDFAEQGVNINFVQDNHSYSAKKGILRGLHYQLQPKAQTKLVRVTAGAIYDIIVDIRQGSPTFGKWNGFILSAENKRQLLVPEGFAHGFCTIEPHTEVLYKVDEFHSSTLERGIAWNDPAIGILWPTKTPILSAKDESHPLLAEAEINFLYKG